MEEAYQFVLMGELIDFTLQRIMEGLPTPPTLFQEVIIEKCRLVNHHFDNVRDHIKIATNVTDTTATVTFYNTLVDKAKIKTVVITNTPDIKNQLVHLWCEVQKILKYYNEEDQKAELASLKSYYDHYDFKRGWAEYNTYEF